MRALASVVTILSIAALVVVGSDILFWRARAPVATAALVGLVAATLGLFTARQVWRHAPSAPLWLGAWGLATVAFQLLMPVLALRHPAPEEQLGRSVVFAFVFAAGLGLAVWRVHHHVRRATAPLTRG